MADRRAQRLYFLKLKKDFFKRHDVTILEALPDGKELLLFYVKLLCESVDHDGRLRFSDEVPYTRKMLAAVTRTAPEVVEEAMGILQELRLLEVQDDGTIFMTKVPEMTTSETVGASEKRDQRRQERDNSGTNVGQCPDNVPQKQDNVPEKRENVPQNIDIRDKSLDLKEMNKEKRPRFVPPSLEEVKALVQERGYHISPEAFVSYYEANGWKVGKNPMKDWKAAVRSWESREKKPDQKPAGSFYRFEEHDHTRQSDAEEEKAMLRKGRSKWLE